MVKFIVAYASTATVFFLLDFLWLGVVAKSFYRERIGALLAEQMNVFPAVAFYLFYVVGVVVFCVAPTLASGGWSKALALGFLFGLVAYGTYDMTNLATLRGWPASVAFVDMIWGATLTAISATAGYLVSKSFQ